MRKKHGRYQTPEYTAWENMIQRCTNQKCAGYRRYGARGIAVCEDWRSFEKFLADMGEKPSPKHSIDRINNDLGYSKENCRWATSSEQLRNYSRNRRIETPMGQMLLCEAAEKSGISQMTLRSRLRYGWPPERMFDPVQKRSSK
jgi:hypothetical protein